MEQFLFELIQISLGKRSSLSRNLTEKEWAAVFETATSHALVGITYFGLKQMPKEQLPPRIIILKWGAIAESLRHRNDVMSNKSVEVLSILNNDGFDALILKGQRNLAYYPQSISSYRAAGDIDVWTFTKEMEPLSERRALLTEYVRQKVGRSDISGIYDIDFEVIDEHVELHFTPSYFVNPWKNRRLQQWFDDFAREWQKQINPHYRHLEFDAFFILLHIFRHYLEEGVGLRQLMDYYMVLTSITDEKTRCFVQKTLDYFGLTRFSSSIMYVLLRVFEGVEDDEIRDSRNHYEWLISEPDCKRGRRVLEAVMTSGNFGTSDCRRDEIYKGKNAFVRFLKREKFYFRNFTDYTWEVVWLPLLQVKRWRLRND